jgi:hypothetical protein
VIERIGLVVQLGALTVVVVIMLLSIRTRRQAREADRQLIQAVEDYNGSLRRLDDRLREGTLQILKCLKGESYAGTFYDMDVHTDPAIPDDQVLMFKLRESQTERKRQ